ncbi:MAG: hypothetical protein WCT99_03625 [Bacteroidota bacterium]
MIIATTVHIFLYLVIAVAIGIGLFFSRKTDGDVTQYFFAGNSKNGVLLGISLSLIVFFTLILLVLPGMRSLDSSIAPVFIVIGSLAIVLFAGGKMLPQLKNFFSSLGKTGNVLMGIHGIVFLAIVQVLVLLQISDVIIQSYFGESYFSLLVVMIVGSGMYALVGGLNAVYYSNMFLGFFFIGSVITVVINVLFLNIPMVFSFRDAFRFGSTVFQDSNLSDLNLFFMGFSVSVLLFWIIWMELGSIQKKISVSTARSLRTGLLIGGAVVLAVITGISYVIQQGAAGTRGSIGTPEPGMIDGIVVVGLLTGLMGVFAVTFQSIGSIAALRIFGSVVKQTNEAEQVLVGRLTTVVAVLLSISLISFAKVSGMQTVVWFVDFLVFFSTPIVAAFAVFALMHKKQFFPVPAGMVIGESYALIGYLSHNNLVHPIFYARNGLYSFVFEIALITVVASVIVFRLSEFRIVQRVFSKTHVSQIGR